MSLPLQVHEYGELDVDGGLLPDGGDCDDRHGGRVHHSEEEEEPIAHRRNAGGNARRDSANTR